MSRLARALLPVAHGALALPATAGDEALLEGAYDALDGFLAEPIAARYLRAVRALRTLSAHRRRSPEIQRLSRRSLDAELDKLERSQAGLGIVGLRSLPADPSAGRRIAALALLLEAHREIAQRVRAPEQLRARVEVLPSAPERRGRGDRRLRRR